MKYLKDFFLFEPKIINIDFDKAERKALSENDLFKEKPLIISCFFHFTQAIIKNMKKYNLFKKRLTKKNIELLRNIQMICFINPVYLKQYSEFLKKNLKSDEEQKFYKYVHNNLISKDYKIFNYYLILKNKDNKYLLPHIYLTNNIAESLHGKISKLIPKNKMSCNDFLNVVKNLIKNNEIKNPEIIRNDYISKTLISIALDINDECFTWITYDKYKEVFNSIVNKD